MNKLHTLSLALLFIATFSISLNAQTVSGPNAGFFCPDLEGSGGDQDLLGFRLLNLSTNGGANELYLGSGNLGQVNQPTGDRVETAYAWQPTQTVTFTVDGSTGNLTLDVNGTMLSFTDGITDSPNGLGVEDITQFCLGIREGSGDISITNLQLNGATVGSGTFETPDQNHWIIGNICLGTPEVHTITFDMALSGMFSNSNEAAKVELLLGSPDNNNCGLAPIPTMSEWGLIVLCLLLMIIGIRVIATSQNMQRVRVLK